MTNNPKIGIINHNFANLHSVKKALDFLNCSNKIIDKPNDLSNEIDAIILPGVGAFDAAIDSLQKSNFISPIKDAANLGTPILGVCLGHQSIGQAFGGNIISAKKIMHGKISPIIHNDSRMYADISNPFNATRYHSLVVEKPSLPNCLNITAWTEEDNDIEIMGIEHKDYPTYGLQFHPESILTTSGHQLLKNFLEI